jgi:uncharacterized protein YbgA (DUF1722 family)
VKSTVRKHVNVLQHIAGYFTHKLDKDGKRKLLNVIEDYHHGLVPLIVPIALVKHYAQLFEISNLQNQVYLNPHLTELMLRTRF